MLSSKTARILRSLSAIFIVVSVVLVSVFGLPLGIDFTSGTATVYSFQSDISSDSLRSALSNAGHDEAIIQQTGEGVFFVRTSELASGEAQTIGNSIFETVGVRAEVLETSSVSSSVASSTIVISIVAVLVASVLVMGYVLISFRNVPSPYRYSLITLATLFHDVVITIGLIVVYGWLFGTQVNTPFIVAILTVVGYSVNDTIVVFDRVREKVQLNPDMSFRALATGAIRETLVRSLGSSLTTLFVVLAMLFIGGDTIRDFLLVFATGIVVGTYSSIFVAISLLVAWEEKKSLRDMLNIGLRS